MLDIISDPKSSQLENGLVDVVFDIALRVTEKDKGRRPGDCLFLPVGPVLGAKDKGDNRKNSGEKDLFHNKNILVISYLSWSTSTSSAIFVAAGRCEMKTIVFRPAKLE